MTDDNQRKQDNQAGGQKSFASSTKLEGGIKYL